MLAADEVVALVAEASGTESLAGPVELSVRVGMSGGEVTSLVCAAESRHVIVHLGDGLDRAVAAADRAAPGEVMVDHVALGPLVADHPAGDLPAWAARTLHPVTASRVAAGSPPPDEHRRITTVFLSIPATGTARAGGFVVAATDLIARMGGDVLQCTGGDKGILLIAVFGVPVAHPDDAGRAVHAVERLREATDVPFAAGVSTGLAFTAAFGGETRRFASVLGDTTNLAARLMAAAEPGTTLIDAATAAGVRRPAGRDADDRGQEPRRAGRGGRGARPAPPPPSSPPTARRRWSAATPSWPPPSGCSTRRRGAAPGRRRGHGQVEAGGRDRRRARVRGIPVRAGRFEAFGGGRPLGPFLAMVDAADIAAVRPGDEALAPLIDHSSPTRRRPRVCPARSGRAGPKADRRPAARRRPD